MTYRSGRRRLDTEVVQTARAGPGSAPLVGRQRELAALVGAALSGPGGLTLVSGEAGSGKSRLLHEVAARAAAAGVRGVAGTRSPMAALSARWPRP